MRRTGSWAIAAISIAAAGLLVFILAVNIDPHLFEKRSPPVVVTGITRSINFAGEAKGNLSVVPLSGCAGCPVVIRAGTSAALPV